MNTTETFNRRSVSRALRNVRYLPFNAAFYSQAAKKGLHARMVFEQKNLYCRNGFRWYKNPERVEKAFIWMIKIGIMRREVDGQGLTSQIRITPLGRAVLETVQSLPAEQLNQIQKLYLWLRQHHWPIR